MKYDIITMGSAVIDAFLETEITETRGDLNIPVGTKILVDELYFDTGGGGTNTAVAFSMLGLKTAYLGKLGKDPNADKILKELKEYRVDFLGVQTEKEPTGFSVIVDSKKHNRTVLTYKGANASLRFNEVKLKKLNSNWFYFGTMTGESLKTEEKLIEILHKKGVKTVFNPSSYVTRYGSDYLKKVLFNTDVLILNEEEVRHLVKGENLFNGLHKLGPKIVCITYGKKGNEVSNGIEKIKTAPSRNLKIVEVTGAGDAFAAGFVFGMMKFNDLKKAAKCGTLNAESAISIPGAKGGMLTWKQVLEGLEKGKVKVICL